MDISMESKSKMLSERYAIFYSFPPLPILIYYVSFLIIYYNSKALSKSKDIYLFVQREDTAFLSLWVFLSNFYFLYDLIAALETSS